MRVKTSLVAAGFAALSPLSLAASERKPGDLDPRFGSGGRAIVRAGLASNASDVVIQRDGKIVVVGSIAKSRLPSGNPDSDFLVARLSRNGQLDRSFGTNGIARTPINLGGSNADYAYAVALAPDGRIVVVGVAENDDVREAAVARYMPTGALDTSFSGDGIQTIDLGPSSFLKGVAVQPDGKVVAVGYAGAGFMVMRLLPDGSLDNSFGSGGIVDTNVGDPRYRDTALAVVVLADGKIVVAGGNDVDYPSYFPESQDFTLVRYLPNGLLDPLFGVDGVVDTPGPKAETPAALALAPDGDLVAAGSSGWPSPGPRFPASGSFHLARYLPWGALDVAFGSGGVVTTSFGPWVTSPASSVAIGPRGGIFAAGFACCAAGRSSRFAVVAYTPSGTLDSSFGVRGRRTYDVFPGHDVASAAARSGNDRLVVVGTSTRRYDNDTRATLIGVDLRAPAACHVPRVVGLTLRGARTRLRARHCRLGRVSRMRSARAAGRVISQHPRAGRRLPNGSRVNVVVSRRR